MPNRPEFWLQASPHVRTAADFARRVERQGWDGLQLADGRSGDVFVALAAAAGKTTTLKLGTGVVNPLTRHPAVLASAIAGIALLAGPRVVLGLGRGDSSLGTLGMQTPSVSSFEQKVQELQQLLAGKYIGGSPTGPHVPWLVSDPGIKVPLDIAATGRRVMNIGARLAERTTLAVGADPSRLRWAFDEVVGSSSSSDPFVGAAVTVALNDDLETARTRARGSLATLLRLSIERPGNTAPLNADDQRELENAASAYELDRHGRSDAAHATALSDDLVDRHAIAGPATRCIERLESIVDLGFKRIVISPGSAGNDHDSMSEAAGELISAVLLKVSV